MNVRYLVVVGSLLAAPANAQFSGDSPPLNGAALFRGQCGTCHVLEPDAAARQGPHLAGVIGRKPGSVAGFKYSAGYEQAEFVWDAAHLDEYLTNPQALIPGSNMAYRQTKPEVRTAIITYLESQPR